ncbi:Long-chain-fatty-acid--CoA ligase FadD15, partial [termite gut metagenome]
MTYHHLAVLVHRQAEKYGDKTALQYRDYEKSEWRPVSWRQFSTFIKETAAAMVALGIKETENIGIFSQNKPECLYTEYAAFANRAVSV